MRFSLAVLALLVGIIPAAARHRHSRWAATGHARHHYVRRATPAGGDVLNSTVYGASLPSVDGTCVDPFDPDPIGGPDHVGDGGPGAFLGRCRGPATVPVR